MSYPVLIADCKRAVLSLQNFSNEELDQIINDEEKIGNILSSLDQSCLKEIEMEKENLLKSIAALAEENLSREPELVEGREKLQALSEEAEKLSKSVEEKVKELKTKTGDLSLETSLALLQTAASETEEESDKIIKKFLENEMELDDFLDEVRAKRKLMHLRLVKAEKLSKILSSGNGAAPTYVNAPPVSINTNYFPGVPGSPTQPGAGPGNVPYPTGPLNMPMPPGMGYFQNHY